MSDRNLFSLVLAASSISFVQDVRVIKPSKKDVDAAKAKGIAEDSADYPKAKQLPLVRPDFADAANASAFVAAFHAAAEKSKPGSGDELLAKIFRSRCSDATMEAVDAEGNFDEAKYIKFLTTEVSGTKTLSQLKAEHAALATELITLGETYQSGPDAIAAAGFGDAAQLLLVISNKRRAWGDLHATIEAREAEAAKKKAKADAKKKSEATAQA